MAHPLHTKAYPLFYGWENVNIFSFVLRLNVTFFFKCVLQWECPLGGISYKLQDRIKRHLAARFTSGIYAHQNKKELQVAI